MSKETAEETKTEGTEAADEVVEVEAAAEGTEKEAGADEAGTEGGETPAEAKADDAAADEVVVTIGDEAPPQEEDNKAPEWVRELRKSNRELARQNRELTKKLETRETAVQAADPGPKPKMSDHDFDAEKFEEALDKWNERKRAADNESAQRQAAEQKAQQAWQAKLSDYGARKAELKAKDVDEAEAEALGQLSQTQQGIVVSGADNPALVVYALGKNPAKLKELSAITDPVKFAFAVAKLEKDLKVTTRKAPPPPERTVTGSAPKSGVVDSQLEKLRAEAERTGDYTKVTAYRRQKRAAS